jgi:hypothetical protein
MLSAGDMEWIDWRPSLVSQMLADRRRADSSASIKSMENAWASGQSAAITIRVKCYEQAGGSYGELIDYAAVASIWVAPTIGVDVYSRVRDQIRMPVSIHPTS